MPTEKRKTSTLKKRYAKNYEIMTSCLLKSEEKHYFVFFIHLLCLRKKLNGKKSITQSWPQTSNRWMFILSCFLCVYKERNDEAVFSKALQCSFTMLVTMFVTKFVRQKDATNMDAILRALQFLYNCQKTNVASVWKIIARCKDHFRLLHL